MGNSSTPGPSPAPPPQLFRFGVFEADPRSGELRKNGNKVRIQEQPFQILLMLLERPGEVISREDLRQRLWSNDTFVDFDHGLNTAINKLREALGDVASNPRFVETLARRGYRFIAPVKVEYPASAVQYSASSVPIDRSEPQPLAQQATGSGPTAAAAPGATLPRPARKVTRTLFMLVQLMYLVFYSVALARLDVIHRTVDSWRSEWGLAIMVLVLVTGPIGIAVRLYLLAATAFDYQRLGLSFRKLFPAVLPLDQLWALASFLLLPQIGIGAAFAACAALLYLPFSQRTLIRMAYAYE